MSYELSVRSYQLRGTELFLTPHFSLLTLFLTPDSELLT